MDYLQDWEIIDNSDFKQLVQKYIIKRKIRFIKHSYHIYHENNLVINKKNICNKIFYLSNFYINKCYLYFKNLNI